MGLYLELREGHINWINKYIENRKKTLIAVLADLRQKNERTNMALKFSTHLWVLVSMESRCHLYMKRTGHKLSKEPLDHILVCTYFDSFIPNMATKFYNMVENFMKNLFLLPLVNICTIRNITCKESITQT